MGERLLCTVREAATMLAVSERMVRRMLADGRLDRVRVGRHVRVRLEDLYDLVNPPQPSVRVKPVVRTRERHPQQRRKASGQRVEKLIDVDAVVARTRP